MNTPWGKVQRTDKYERGFFFVSTTGHGGYMVAEGYARRHLSPSAINRGTFYNGYYCYEEDCNWMIPVFERPHLWTEIFKYEPEIIPGAYLLQNLSRWHPYYLIERGITPEENAFDSYKAHVIENQMRQNKDPNLIVSAVSKRVDEIYRLEVITADGKHHFVENYKSHTPNLLSDCKIISYSGPCLFYTEGGEHKIVGFM
jgi:hypothetical protein